MRDMKWQSLKTYLWVEDEEADKGELRTNFTGLETKEEKIPRGP